MSKLFRFKIPSRQFSSVFRQDVWSKGVVRSPCKDIEIPKLTLNEYVWRNLDKWPTKVAMVSNTLLVNTSVLNRLPCFCKDDQELV